MQLQNRVNPYGDVVFSESRERTLMGNRGNLHNDKRQIIRKSRIKGWVSCLLEFQGIDRRPLMKPGQYTELFFLDEVASFSAGHRPCNTCQKERFKFFKETWLSVNKSIYKINGNKITDVDEVLHAERIAENGEKVTSQAVVSDLPDGAYVEIGGKYFLKWKSLLLEWSFNGYVAAKELPLNQEVTVLTPPSILRCFENGFVPKVHVSALKYYK